MIERLKLINWLLVADVTVCIPAHRLLVSEQEKGSVSAFSTSLFNTTVIGFFLLFMMSIAGLAGYEWKKVSIEPGSMEKLPQFPKLSFAFAMLAAAVFTVYWIV